MHPDFFNKNREYVIYWEDIKALHAVTHATFLRMLSYERGEIGSVLRSRQVTKTEFLIALKLESL